VNQLKFGNAIYIIHTRNEWHKSRDCIARKYMTLDDRMLL